MTYEERVEQAIASGMEARQVIKLRYENQILREQLNQYIWVVRGMAVLAVLDAALIIRYLL
jgi:hypothetical protein